MWVGGLEGPKFMGSMHGEMVPLFSKSWEQMLPPHLWDLWKDGTTFPRDPGVNVPTTLKHGYIRSGQDNSVGFLV